MYLTLVITYVCVCVRIYAQGIFAYTNSYCSPSKRTVRPFFSTLILTLSYFGTYVRMYVRTRSVHSCLCTRMFTTHLCVPSILIRPHSLRIHSSFVCTYVRTYMCTIHSLPPYLDTFRIISHSCTFFKQNCKALPLF